MNNLKKYFFLFGMLLLVITENSCKKFLDEKQDKSLVVPSTLRDLQALMDNSRISQWDPGMNDHSADEYYLFQAQYNGMRESERRLYTWEKDFTNLPFANDWAYTWDKIFVANTVLSFLPTIERNQNNATDWDNVKGQALAIRGKSFQVLAYTWSLAYDPATSESDLGLPLRLDPDFNAPSVRSSNEETYQQIISDLSEAAQLLPNTSVHVKRMSKPAAYGLLARTYLSMRQYEKAGLYADSCLKISNTLLDYNNLVATASYPIAQFNAEVIWQCFSFLHDGPYNSNARVDSVLYSSYADNDLRKVLYFKSVSPGVYNYCGSYEGSSNLFSGLATDEVYLTRAESFARVGNKDAALNDLNTLLLKRWKKNTFVPLTAPDATSALSIILTERKKELLFRNLRWMDIKRRNKEGANIILKRIINNTTYTLPPNDPRYAHEIPQEVIALSKMQQNPR